MSAEIHDLVHEDRELTALPVLHQHMDNAVGKLHGIFAKDLAGYVVFAVSGKGEWSCGWAVDPKSVIGARMLCGLAVEGIREDMIVDGAMNARVGEP